MSQAERLCISCRRPKAERDCGLCEEPVCKSCAMFLAEDAFEMMPEKPATLSHSYYCPQCFQNEVEPEVARYADMLAQAREVLVFEKPVQVLKRSKTPIVIEKCADRDEAKLRMAMIAVGQGYNALTEFELKSEKVRNHGWQTNNWRGRTVPALVDRSRFERDWDN